jgi:6-pyruvoyltetrahydropterin/6-carboxytetrahydropterin synthase
MYIVSIESSFTASHQLTLPDGLDEPVHNHEWLVTAEVASEKLNDIAVVMNFRELKALVDNIVGEFDNLDLNKFSYFQQNNPSAENVARYIYDKLRNQLPKDVKTQSIKVIEEPGCSAKFSE